MQEQLKLLEELQALDLQVQRTERELEELPVRLKALQDDVASVEALLESERRQLREVEAYRAEIDITIKTEQAQISKSKAKMTQVRTSKEYMAVQREFETNRRLIGEREQELSKLNQAIEQTVQSIAKHEQELEELRQHVADEERDTLAKLGELGSSVAEQRVARAQTSERVTKTLLSRYDQIRRLRGGLAVVKVEGGVCTGCRMHLPPQLYNMLQRSDTVEQCPTCQRIVFVARSEEASAGGMNRAENPAETPLETEARPELANSAGESPA